ncbi:MULTISPECIES: AAA family ATPase [Tenacibaculum]|uniref:AAA family ATPase n=1 Tax=Tenacibaculum TaxID=104267 RepID=UPI00089C1951|nr:MULTISPECIES: ATP-binding protein [unclassified Tenacibaculum]RBW55783.1 ATPase [Tenacibaculum sp. E3R01]SEE62768.1 Predicted ATPase [Tenacibaculum sp. MAR_2010_89]
MQQKIVLIGGPGTGKSSILKEFIKRGYECMPEISREVTLTAQKEGIDQLFLDQPLLFSQMLLEGREKQYLDATQSEKEIIFFDRGVPDVHAYMNYLGTDYPDTYIKKSNQCTYDKVFMLAPWEEIYKSDNERYETFEQAVKIDRYLRETYEEVGYTIIDVPFGSVKERCDFILHSLKNDV